MIVSLMANHCIEHDDTPIINENEAYKSLELDVHYHPSPLESDSENSYQNLESLKFQSLNNIPITFDLAETGVTVDSPESSTGKKFPLSILTNHKPPIEKKRIEYGLRPQRRKKIYFLPSLSIPD